MVSVTVVLLGCFDLGLAAMVAAAACFVRASARPKPTLLRAGWLHDEVSHEQWWPRAGGAQRVLMARAEGPLLFVSAPRIDALLSDRPPWPAYLLLDVCEVSELDGTACAALQHLCACVEARGGRMVWVAQPGSEAFTVLQRTGLAARGLGGTLCFDVGLAIDRIARDHAERSYQMAPERPAPQRAAHLRLLRAPLDGAG